MFDPVTAIVGAGAVAGGMGLAGSAMQAGASESAGQAAADASLAGQQLSYDEWLKEQENMAPWIKTGQAGLSALAYAMGLPGYDEGGVASGSAANKGGLLGIPAFSFDPTQIEANPDYQWVRGQGIDALSAAGAASGNYGSGNMGTALERFAEGNASNFMNQYYNQALGTYGQNLNSQYTMPYNMLAGISNTGQGQSQALGGLGMDAASAMGRYGTAAANAYGQGQVGAANAYAGGLNSLANQIMSGYGLYMKNRPGSFASAPSSDGGVGWDYASFL